jgi:hypothetical protein
MLHLNGQQSSHLSRRYSHRSEIAFDSGAVVLREGIIEPRCNVLAVQRNLSFSGQRFQFVVHHKLKRFGRGIPHEQVEN